MKKSLILLLFPFFAAAQDCTVKKQTDPFTHQTKVTTGFIPLGTGLGRVLLSIDGDSKEINLLFSINGAGNNKCFDDASTATILFDGSKVKTNLRNNAPMNCEGTFNINFRNGASAPAQLQKLSAQKVNNIKLTGSNNNIVDIILSEEQKQLLMKMTDCLIKEAKTLITP